MWLKEFRAGIMLSQDRLKRVFGVALPAAYAGYLLLSYPVPS